MTDLVDIRPLVHGQDDEALMGLFQRAADYVMLEDGCAPTLAKVSEFFASVVPGGELADAAKLGAWRDGVLLGLGDMSFGYPLASDAYIGLVMFDPALRGRGLGRQMLVALTAIAAQRGATRMLVAVLEANPRGQAFWQREGFTIERSFEPLADDPLAHRRFRMQRLVLAQ